MFYEKSISAIKTMISESSISTEEDGEGITPIRSPEDRSHTPPHHILWMCEEIKRWDTKSVKCTAKAGRWIGYIFRWMEESKFHWTNVTSRHYAKIDGDAGFDIPHHDPP